MNKIAAEAYDLFTALNEYNIHFGSDVYNGDYYLIIPYPNDRNRDIFVISTEIDGRVMWKVDYHGHSMRTYSHYILLCTDDLVEELVENGYSENA